jgi:hypothetical protein
MRGSGVSRYPGGDRSLAVAAQNQRCRAARINLICLFFGLSAALTAAPSYSFHVAGDEAGSWPGILLSIGFVPAAGGQADIFVFPSGSEPDPQLWLPRLEQGACLVLEGESGLARTLGINRGQQKVPVGSLIDEHNPGLPIVWEHALDLPVFQVPEAARIFARERWKGYPLVVGLRRGNGSVLWVAAPPGAQGYERFPYLPQALADLGHEPPVRSARLWAFFDSSYRSRVDLGWFARRWRRSGIAALQVAAWHFWEPDEARDKYLRELIAACHRNAILVYAWFEFPHVSEQFWHDHPEWREKTALGQDAQLDWRKLMNLANKECFGAAAGGTERLIASFDWDGVNLAELYFESLEGAANPARFTPLNGDVRAGFRQSHNVDPADLFVPGSARDKDLRAFLDYRAALAHRIQAQWIEELEKVRRKKPHLELVLTHVDDRFDPSMKDKIAADVAALLPMAESRDITFLIEDPATVWNLGPQRYPEIRKRYQGISHSPAGLAIDINIVERYQDVYPTKQQTGTELFQLVHLASASFPRVALYFEQSILKPDLQLLPAAASVVRRLERTGGKLIVDSPFGAGLRWDGPALVNGRPWPVTSEGVVWLPAGAVTVEPAATSPTFRVVDYNADLRGATSISGGVELAYQSRARAYFVFNAPPGRIDLDGAIYDAEAVRTDTGYTLILPRGQHLVTVHAE